ncbi:MAG: hypothetical protein IT447_02455 [Phycisphaerales bacterium]|nr:hypothetical protein [Phycisphaerales bacterium]
MKAMWNSAIQRVAARPARRGISVMYAIVVLVMLVGVCSLAVDLGRVQLAKSELQRAVDAAARAGAAKISGSKKAARNAAKQVAKLNLVDGNQLILANSNITYTFYDETTRTFKPSQTPLNAVIVTAKLEGTNGIPLIFGALLGRQYQSIHATATAAYITPIDVTGDISSAANPWLAGMPSGTVANPNNPHHNPDIAGKSKPSAGYLDPSPTLITDLPLQPGTAINFSSVSGYSNNDNDWDPIYDPDGNGSWIVHNRYSSSGGPENGMSDMYAPINAIVGVFLDDSKPNMTSPPPTLNFSTPESRDFTTLSPQLKQVFFIGDGMTSDEIVQQFIIPSGATRLFIGQMDEYEWNNNTGNRTYRFSRPGRIELVK